MVTFLRPLTILVSNISLLSIYLNHSIRQKSTDIEIFFCFVFFLQYLFLVLFVIYDIFGFLHIYLIYQNTHFSFWVFFLVSEDNTLVEEDICDAMKKICFGVGQ